MLWIFALAVFGQKRGVAYGHHTPEDLEVLSPGISWWYNWSEVPETAIADVYDSYGFDFVPMTWNGSFNESKLRQFLASHPQTKYLLAFNEPNFKDQANMTPTQVAAIWPKLEAIAADFNLDIVGPAVNYCDNCVAEKGTTYTDPIQYLDDFFAACPGCQVDHIAVHCYMNHASALTWYISLFKKYQKPIWLTEFSGWEYNGAINSPDDQVKYMMEAVELLENEPDIFRYAWFIGRASGIQNFPFIDLLEANGELTKLGQVYTQMPVHDVDNVIQIPARIEAEDYNKKQGMVMNITSDEEGFVHMGEANVNDFLEYRINVHTSGNYIFNLRVSSTKRTAIKLYLDGKAIQTCQIADTEGYDNWVTLSQTMDLLAGEHTLKLVALNSGFQLNWFEITPVVSVDKVSVENDDMVLYPLPVHDELNIQCGVASVEQIQVYNIYGIKVLQQKYKRKIDVGHLAKGTYFLSVTTGSGQYRKKIIKL